MPRETALARGHRALSMVEIGEIKGMLARRDRQCDIAVWHGVSQSFVNRLKKGRYPEYAHVGVVPQASLPPPGPYKLVTQTVADRALVNAEIVKELERLLAVYGKTS